MYPKNAAPRFSICSATLRVDIDATTIADQKSFERRIEEARRRVERALSILRRLCQNGGIKLTTFVSLDINSLTNMTHCSPIGYPSDEIRSLLRESSLSVSKRRGTGAVDATTRAYPG